MAWVHTTYYAGQVYHADEAPYDLSINLPVTARSLDKAELFTGEGMSRGCLWSQQSRALTRDGTALIEKFESLIGFDLFDLGLVSLGHVRGIG